MSEAPVVIVGGGLAGLAAARTLHAAGTPCLLLERSDAVGGRVRTDLVDGFRLDRGFQVLLDAYPECRAQLDYAALDLRPFYPGADVWYRGRFHRVADPFRAPLDAVRGLLNPVGRVSDKVRVLALRRRALDGPLRALWERPETTTTETLTRVGFSDALIDRFFRPFLGGIFLGRDLRTSSRMLDFVFRMLATGRTVVPGRGMEEIPRQLARALPVTGVRLGVTVRAVAPDHVVLDDGTRVDARAVLVATEGDTAATLLGLAAPPAPRSVAALYFAAAAPPVRGNLLLLDGEGTGPANNVAVMSEVSPHYAPHDQALVVASVLGEPARDDAALQAAVRVQLTRWFGDEVTRWRHLRTYRIRWAQPSQDPPALTPASRPVRVADRLFVAGDHRENASLHGALRSGRLAAEALLAG